MRVFVVGASGAIGARLVPRLIAHGHEVIELDAAGIYNITDDEPAPMRDWLPALATALSAKPPCHVPPWLARLIAGQGMVMMAVGSRGASNEKAKRDLGWTLRYPSWRLGFPAAYPAAAPATAGRLTRSPAAASATRHDNG